ncbi:guanine nucleotide exchange factor in Golgi transport N-terminal-domain-containing protein [Suillus cothurnatus]|nr:guanine nucleotide exchange factor in Golgi transport N-terminal-domain-containing protein [Suillus cothurnatus]
MDIRTWSIETCHRTAFQGYWIGILKIGSSIIVTLEGKVVFVAPTVTLVTQQTDSCHCTWLRLDRPYYEHIRPGCEALEHKENADFNTWRRERNLKSHATRSKLLSLHLVLTILNSYVAPFVDSKAIIYSSSTNEATTFVQAVNQYLHFSLSRNVVNPVPQVFEVSMEIFWQVLSGMRTKLKKEIEVLLHEIFIPILEMKTSTLKRKDVIIGMLCRLRQDPQALVEIYLDYDCDSEATDNIYEQSTTLLYTCSPQKTNDPANSALPPQTKSSASTAHVSGALTVSGTMDMSTMCLSEGQLRRQGLECLLAVLMSWNSRWENARGIRNCRYCPNSRSQVGEEIATDTMTPDPSLGGVIASVGSTEAFRQSTLDTADDPSIFERFLSTTDSFSKSIIGEYLGEGNLGFVDAVCILPSRKIDRFMLKFVERYIAGKCLNTLQECRMTDEVNATINLPSVGLGLANVLANVGRDLQKEAHVMLFSGVENKAEALFRTLIRSQRRGSRAGDQYFNSRRIVCFFDLDLERNAFVSLPAKFTFLNNDLGGSRRDVLSCVLQLEHMQLIGGGVEVSDGGKKGRSKKLPAEELANENRSTHISVPADVVFSLSYYLSGVRSSF